MPLLQNAGLPTGEQHRQPIQLVLISGHPVTNLLAEQLVSLLLDGKAPIKPSAAP